MNRLRTELRERTRQAHERLDRLFSGLDITRRDGYARFLASQAPALEAVEAQLDAAGAQRVIPDWSERRRTAALRRDLEALAEMQPRPASDAGWICDHAAILGAAYVLEGSRLGGKMLLKHVLASSDPALAGAVRFLGHGEGRRFWPAFDALLAETELSEAEVDRMVDSAVRTFALFERCALDTLQPVQA